MKKDKADLQPHLMHECVIALCKGSLHCTGGPWAVNNSERSRGGLGSQPEFWRAAAELGLLNFCGTALQVYSFRTPSSFRAWGPWGSHLSCMPRSPPAKAN